MGNSISARHLLAGVAVAAGISGCARGTSVPVAPTTATLSVASITPNTGSTGGRTAVTIAGTGFHAGAAVTFDGIQADVVSVTGLVLTATAPSHGPGTVDVVVINPGGERARAGGYTYTVTPPPSVTAVSAGLGSTVGGAPLTIQGAGFAAGLTVAFGDAAATIVSSSAIRMQVTAPAHAAGTVDLIVTNPDGQADILPAAYTYAPPASFPMNGEWYGVAETEAALTFTIRNDLLISFSCGTTIVTLSPPPSVSAGAISFTGADGARIMGRFVSADYAVGTIDVPSCRSSWDAIRRAGSAP